MKALFEHPHLDVFYEFAGEGDFVPGGVLLVVDTRRHIDAAVGLESHGYFIFVETVAEETGMAYYYPAFPDGKGGIVPRTDECRFAPVRNFFRSTTMVVLRKRDIAKVVPIRRAA